MGGWGLQYSEHVGPKLRVFWNFGEMWGLYSPKTMSFYFRITVRTALVFAISKGKRLKYQFSISSQRTF